MSVPEQVRMLALKKVQVLVLVREREPGKGKESRRGMMKPPERKVPKTG